jgi:rhodanese-related sulfurtransferase
MLTSKEGYVVVDVRTPEEIEADGTVEGFLHIPISEFDQRFSEIPRDKKVIVACSRGARSGRAAAILQRHGYQDVYSAGLAEYKSKGYKLIYPKLAR